MLRILRAFVWMRWRVLVNSLERTGARDPLERFSIAMEQIAPLMAIVLLVPSVLGAAGLGASAGYALAGDGPRPSHKSRTAQLTTCSSACCNCSSSQRSSVPPVTYSAHIARSLCGADADS